MSSRGVNTTEKFVSDAWEQVFPFTVLQDLLETHTITSCSHIFSWIEERSKRLTIGMVPQKGKALILLRTLNDLLRRLSKMGSATKFCGRILTFLSGVFPLGERSGVNLRGEYGPVWEGVKVIKKVEDEGEDHERSTAENEGEKMQVDQPPAKVANLQNGLQRRFSVLSSSHAYLDFYRTFWSLQLPFSRPPIFASPSTYSFSVFKESVNSVLPYIKEANAKERAMLGSRSGSGVPASLKRKREQALEESPMTDYFFAKFLTSPELLELEVRYPRPHFILSLSERSFVRSLIPISADNFCFNSSFFSTICSPLPNLRKQLGQLSVTVLYKWISR